MQVNTKALAVSPLFAQVDPGSIPDILSCLGAHTRTYEKNEIIFREGLPLSEIGVVLSGGVYIQHEDYWGNRTILARVGLGGLFGEAFSCVGVDRLPVSVLAVEDTTVLLIDCRRIITTCPRPVPSTTGW